MQSDAEWEERGVGPGKTSTQVKPRRSFQDELIVSLSRW